MHKTSQNPAATSAVEIPFLSDATEYDRLLDQYSVTYFAVIDPRIDGKAQYHMPISPWYATRAQAEQCYAQKQADFPDCYVGKFENYFTAECEKGRLELLTQVIGVDQGDPPASGRVLGVQFYGRTGWRRRSRLSYCVF